jgi:hypothetical protein
MSFYTEAPVVTKATVDAVQNPGRGIDMITDVDMIMRSNPGYSGMFRRLHEERKADDGRFTGEWKKVAELMVPHEMAVRMIEPDFLKSKKTFFAWLDRNPRYCTYDRRRAKTISDRFFRMGGLDGQASG